MSVMNAYVDDYGKITVYLSRNFFGGRTNDFYLSDEKGNSWDCIIRNVEERRDEVVYELVIPSDLEIGFRYYVRESHGKQVEVKFRYIVQKPEFDRMFTYDGSNLGAVYHLTYTTFALWAPTAVNVMVRINHERKVHVLNMRRTSQGVWRAKWSGDLKRATYVYLVDRNGEIVECTDPYGISSNANGRESAVINLASVESIKDYEVKTRVRTPADAVIYEINVRDLTSNPVDDGHVQKRGTYAAFIEKGTQLKGKSTGLDYLVSLGVTHVQLQPVLDFATVDEYHPEWGYNWGYDAQQFMTLEGSYSTSPNDPYARMMEFRKLVTTLHKNNIRVTLDLVFNHMYETHENCLEAAVPYYYFRYNQSGGLSNGSFCGNDLNSLRPMTRHLFLHAIRFLMKTYGVDGFRFDLMGIIDIHTMNLIRQETLKIKPDALVYGEGWDMPTAMNDELKAKIFNQDKMPGIGHFNDTFRDVLKGSTSDNQKSAKGYLTGNSGLIYEACGVLSGNTMGAPYFMRFDHPVKSINAIETHDNATLWDKMHACCSEEPRELRKKRQKMMIACTMFAQGVPFLHAGIEFCGTKQDNSNSYNAGDAVNGMNWERMLFNYDVVEYTRAAIRTRQFYPAFRLATGDDVKRFVKTYVLDNGVLQYDINYAEPGASGRGIRVLINPSMQSYTYYYNDAAYRIIFDENGGAHAETKNEIHIEACSVVAALLI